MAYVQFPVFNLLESYHALSPAWSLVDSILQPAGTVVQESSFQKFILESRDLSWIVPKYGKPSDVT